MNTNFSVVTSDIKKVSVTITRKALWDNFVMCWKDTAWDDYVSARHLMDDVAKLLLSGDKLDTQNLRKLFREGLTCMFMCDGMRFLDTRTEIHREIIVDDDGEKHVIRHEHINF
jgi:hypothetical protein